MIVKVELWAFQKGVVREVNIPIESGNIHDLTELVFYWGQNDFQPVQGRCSVSAGDVICHDGKYILFVSIGCKELTEKEYKDYIQMDEYQRVMSLRRLSYHYKGNHE